MPRFRIYPIDPVSPPIEFKSRDVAQVLSVLKGLGVGHADVWRNQKYRFSVRIQSNGLLYIYQRAKAAAREEISESLRSQP